MLQTNGSIFDRSPYHVFTATKLKEMINNDQSQSISDLKDQCLFYYVKLESAYKKMKSLKN